jgi:hypothetical protein
MNNPIWGEVEEALTDALSMHWDGCHKIYLSMDEGQVAQMDEYGYDLVTPDYDLIREWFDLSCSLRFINAVHTNVEDPNAGFEDLIPQFYFEDLEAEDEYDDED